MLALALFACLASVAVPASASNPEERLDQLRRKREQVGDRIHATDQKGHALDSRIRTLDVRAEDIQEHISSLDNEIAALDEQISVAQAQLSEAQRHLAALSEELATIEARLDDRTEVFTERAIEAYKAGPNAALSGLLTSESFSDLVDRYEYYESALEADTELLNEIAVLRSTTEDRRAEVEAQEQEIAATKLQLETDRLEVADVRDEKSTALEAQRVLIADKKEVLRGVLAREDRLRDLADELERDSDRVRALLAAQAAPDPPTPQAAPDPPTPQAAPATPDPPTSPVTSSPPPASPPSPDPSPPSPPPSSGGELAWPAWGPVISPFGYRTHPIFGDTRLHSGIDIGAPYGAPVWAADDGVVVFAGTMSGYGNAVVVDHGGGLATTYNHLSAFQVGTGQRVGRGQQIANVGCTGYCTGPHLHFEVRTNGTPVDPMPYLQ